jgi:hypothetical protein
MRHIVSFGMAALIVFLIGVPSSSSKRGTPATIQNRETVQRLYGSPVSEIYRTPQNLTVDASFASNSNLCQADIGSDGDAGITDKQLDPVLDALAPQDVRGKAKMDTFLNVTCLKIEKPENSSADSSGKLVVDPCVECSGVSEDYERVKITKYGNTNQYRSVHITFKRPECKELDSARH